MILALVMPGLPPRALDAQVLYGSIVGAVRDSSGAAVPGATVTATNSQTNLVLTGVTNEAGNFTISNVQPGAYDVKVELQGFREFVRTGVPVTANTISRVNATLEIGELAETVTVASEAALLQTDRADTHTELKSKEVTDLPLSNYRNYQSLMNLVPGATPATFQNALTDTPARSLRTFVNGQNPNSNATKTDGATNLNIWLPHHVMYVSPAETVDTVNISTSNFSAEQGQAGGAAVTVLTKSGTNQLSGSAFELFNNERLNARPFFDPEKLPIDRHIAGGTLGGPILRNRLFYFGSYEGFFERSSAFEFLDVPSVALRGGDFGNATNEDGSVQTIHDPATGNPDGTGRQPFPSNVMPHNRMSPAAQRLLDLYPAPNTGEAHDATRNFLRQNDTDVDRHNADVKINWNRTSSHQIWGKYSQMNAVVGNLFYLGVDGSGKGDTKVYQSTLGHTWTLGPTLVLDSTFGFSRQDQTVLASDFELGFFGRDVLGIPGTNGGSGQFADDERYSGFPQFNIGFSTLGNSAGWNPLFRDERTYAITTNVTKTAGNHELRFGYSGNYLYLDHWQPEIANPRGNFDFAGNATALNGGQTPNLYNTYAAFLLGLVGTASKSAQYELMTAREWQHALYINDRWQLSDRMTLNLGVRYEYYPLMTRADRGIERLDLDTMEVLLGGVGGNPENLGLDAGNGLFAPRLGLTYRLGDDTVFRIGYGITYNPLPFARPLRGFYPLTIAGTFTQDNEWGWVSRLDEGIPEVVGPDLSTGRIALPSSVSMRTPETDLTRGSIQSW
ncbi:MAG: TonB-dependent receptor, partial [Vicinamibacteraceae bacterium]